MNSHLKESRPKVSLEDVLRLKRNERPSVKFWEDFDRDLRRRTLQALVSEEPWNPSRFRMLFIRLATSVSVTAAAVAALVYIVLQNGAAIKEHEALEHRVAGAKPVELSTGPQLVESRQSQNFTIFRSPRLQKTFVIEVIEVLQEKELSYQKNLMPRTFTALSSIPESRPPSNIQGIPVRDDVRFVSAPSLQYF
ncbi:MAG: hypothetical protein DF168_01157 [Candidatus Moanabacter tarae]|uniref:Uncharacterized protein n=1 Tax=Candidatus Moanibacter tarae TaxID=2200854 RepID=A0A2Z4ACS8_9BACT|nr:MAG: hypothetical protein DF168_01157 [Candidatus Moanabacter tarae]|tara:strand:- start:12212 stop:12793 length:582 start_codon:yes stop_codon:yes gene_type:complete